MIDFFFTNLYTTKNTGDACFLQLDFPIFLILCGETNKS